MLLYEIEPRVKRDMAGQASALILSDSTQLRESLMVLLRAIPRIECVKQAEDILTAFSEFPTAPPDLVLCDLGSVQGSALSTLRCLKARWPSTRCLALVENEEARMAAEAAGADVVLTKGVLAARLVETIEGLL